MKKRNFFMLLAALVIVGLGLFAYKALWLGYPLHPRSYVPVWNLQARFTFQGAGGPVAARLNLPLSTHRFYVGREQFIHGDYGYTVTPDQHGNRELVWTKRAVNGRQTLYYRATLARVRAKPPKSGGPAPVAVNPHWDGARLHAAKTALAELKAKSATPRSLVLLLLKELNSPNYRERFAPLLPAEPHSRHKTSLAVDLLNLADIPARQVHGVVLKPQDRRTVAPSHWLEAWLDGKWAAFNPHTGLPGLPPDSLPWWRGDLPLYSLSGGKDAKVVLSLSVGQVAISRAWNAVTPGWLKRISLRNLPVDTQQVYRVLLVVPLGALLLVFLRNFVGIKTFGTFMPVLIALAFRETRLAAGVVMFIMVISAGMVVRFYLDRLRLLVVPRLAAVLIVVILIMMGLSQLTYQLGLSAGLSVALFPMVILTMTIERMSIVWDERGPGEAIKQALGSLGCAAIAYLAMTSKLAIHLLFTFPELLLVLLALVIAAGRYTGFRLLELKRFRALAQEAK